MTQQATTTSTGVSAVLSMLHEPAQSNSATRVFRHQPVLAWTLHRLQQCHHVVQIAVICWEDQLQAVSLVAEQYCVAVNHRGPRQNIAALNAVATAQRWADGWRGGLLGTCDFDAGCHPQWIAEVIEELGTDRAVLIDPASALLDPVLIDGLISHAAAHPDNELAFLHAAPGLGGALVTLSLLQRLAMVGLHPGRLLHYMPDQPGRDPIGTDLAAPVPMEVARTSHRFKLDSDRQLRRASIAFQSLNGQLTSSNAQTLVQHMDALRHQVDPLPREVVLELTTRRMTRPIFSPVAHLPLERPDLSLEQAEKLFASLAQADDMRLTLAGAGDPLLHPQCLAIVNLARHHGLHIHLETDLLLEDPSTIQALVHAGIDIVSVHLPALSPTIYHQVMGVDALMPAIQNIKHLLIARQNRGVGLPLVVPTFVKCRVNLHEMEAWYDQWLKAVGSAVIVGPTALAGQIPDCGVADMAPPKRRACGRLWSRLTVLSDGRIVACEQDVLGKHPIGRLDDSTIDHVWQQAMQPVRASHKSLELNVLPLCQSCNEWHRP